MGLSGHAFRLMIYKSGVYIEPPFDGEGYYFRYHTFPAIGYEQRMYHDPHDASEYSPEERTQAIKESLKHDLPALICYPFPNWGVIVGYENAGYIVNSYDGKMSKLDKIEGDFCILGKASHVQLSDSIRKSFQIDTEYAFKKRMPKGENGWFGKYHSGISAYGAWISHLKRNRVKDEFANWWNYGTLLDARRSVVDYLVQTKQFYNGNALQQLEELVEKYKNIVSFLQQNLKYFPRREDITEFTGGAVTTLEVVREMEEEAFIFIKDSRLAKVMS